MYLQTGPCEDILKVSGSNWKKEHHAFDLQQINSNLFANKLRKLYLLF